MKRATQDQLDALKELINIGVGEAAQSLSTLLDSRIDLQVPSITVIDCENISESAFELKSSVNSCVRQNFKGDCCGFAALIMPPQSASNLVVAVSDYDFEETEVNAVMADTLNEVGNIIINGVIGSIGNVLNTRFDYTLPIYLEGRVMELLKANDLPANASIVLVRMLFGIKELEIEGSLFVVLKVDTVDNLLSSIERLYSQ